MPSKKQTKTKVTTSLKKASKALGTTKKKAGAAQKAAKKGVKKAVKKVVKKAAPRAKVAAKKARTLTKKASVKKKVAAAKKVAKKAVTPKKAAKKATARKQVRAKVTKKLAASRNLITLEDLFADIDTAEPQKAKRKGLTLADLFDGMDRREAAFAVKDSVEQGVNTTPAYSTIIRSTLPRPNDQQKADDGARVIFEQEQGAFFERLQVFHKIAMSLGVAIFMIVVGGLWFQVTKGYFEETSQNQDSAVELLQEATQRNKQQFEEVTSQVQQRIQMVQQEVAENQKLQQEIDSITQELRKELESQDSTTTQN